MTKQNKQLNQTPPISSTDPVRLQLWVRAGGRCEFYGCNEYLLDHELTGHTLLNLSDIAHIVGRKETAARGKDSMPHKDRNKIENLMLLCSVCHNKIIDKTELRPEFPKELLLGYKQKHEDLIKYLTSLALPGFESVTLRMIGNIRGNSVMIPDEQVRNAILMDKKYPRYLLSKENGIEINLTNLDDTDSTYWTEGFKIIDRVLDRQVSPAVDEKEIKHISVLPFARIPFIIYLGNKLGDKINTTIYQKQRDEGEMWSWKDGEVVNFEYHKIQEGKQRDKIAILLSLSGAITRESLPQDIDDEFTIYEMAPIGVQPGRTVFQTKQTVDAFRKKYSELLRSIESIYPKDCTLHLFPAVPISAAFHCGRELMKGTTPRLAVYDRNNDFKFIKITEIL